MEQIKMTAFHAKEAHFFFKRLFRKHPMCLILSQWKLFLKATKIHKVTCQYVKCESVNHSQRLLICNSPTSLCIFIRFQNADKEKNFL